MNIIQFGKLEDKLDTRSTLFITDKNFTVVKGYVDNLTSDLKEKENCLINNLHSLELNNNYITIKYINDKQKQKYFCIDNLMSHNLDSDKDGTIDSIDSLYNHLGKTYFNTETSRKENASEVLYNSFFYIIAIFFSLLMSYLIWFYPSYIYNEHENTSIKKAMVNFILGIMKKYVDFFGPNLAGGILLVLAVFLIYKIIKRFNNKKDIKIYIK